MDQQKKFFDQIEEAFSEDADETAKRLISENISKVENDYRALIEARNNLLEANLIKEIRNGNRSKLATLLGGTKYSIIYKEDDNIAKEIISKNIFEGYHLTTQILEKLKIIDSVDYVFSYVDSEGKFHRVENATLTLDMVDLQRSSKSAQEAALRFRADKIQALFEDTDELLNKHYQAFTQVYRNYENNNSTGWKANKGVMVEAFERHWENLEHSLMKAQDFKKNKIGNDLESEGRRWMMYRESSGSDPYFTGPDTMYSQVKATNASLISNVDTVLNAMEAVITLIENYNHIENLAQKLKKAFKASPSRATFPKKVWDGLTDNVKQQIKDEMAQMHGIENMEVIVKGETIIFKQQKGK